MPSYPLHEGCETLIECESIAFSVTEALPQPRYRCGHVVTLVRHKVLCLFIVTYHGFEQPDEEVSWHYAL